MNQSNVANVDTGYAGRIGVFELLKDRSDDPTDVLGEPQHGRDYAIKAGMTTLRSSGWEQVQVGVTSIEEVLRITRGDVIG
ncbi:MAG: hypothetical protein U0936_03510 [Planctomycetaceae bacterium]